MKELPTHFTPPLSRVQRQLLFRCLGFGAFRCVVVEALGDVVLRAGRYVGLESEPLLGGSTPESWLREEAPEATLLLQVEGTVVPSLSLEHKPSLWEELLPYPYTQIARVYEGGGRWRLHARPSSLEQDCERLWESLVALEERLRETELSVVSFQGPNGSCPLLFHYSRGRRIRIGTRDELRVISERCLKGEWDEADLQKHFGTRAAFYPVRWESGPSPMAALAEALPEGLPPGAIRPSLGPQIGL